MYAAEGGTGVSVALLLEANANTELQDNVRVATCDRIGPGAAARAIARAPPFRSG